MPVQETSIRIYYDKILPIIGRRKAQILNVFLERYPENLSNTEISRHLKWSICRVTPRVKELRRDDKLLELAEKRLCRINHNRVMAWKLSTNYGMLDRAVIGNLLRGVKGWEEYADHLDLVDGELHVVEFIPHEMWRVIHKRMKKKGYRYNGYASWVKN